MSHRSPVPLTTTAATLPMARWLSRAGRDETLLCHAVRYRCRGWNGEAADPVADVEWALDEVVRRYGDIPVGLVGTDIGARAALHAAGHPAVRAVVALAPWLPKDKGTRDTREKRRTEHDPVKQLGGRQVLIVHGTDDRVTAPELSYRLALRAKQDGCEICRFEVHTDGHALRQYRREVLALVTDFILGSLCDHDFARPVADAIAAPPPLGLRMPLAAGFTRGLR